MRHKLSCYGFTASVHFWAERQSVDINANSGSQNRRLREAEYYIICVLRLNYASACGESLKVSATRHFLPIAKVTVCGGSGLWRERYAFSAVFFYIVMDFGIRSRVVTELIVVYFLYF